MATRACLVSLLVAAAVVLFERAVAAGTVETSEVQSLLWRLNKPPVATIQSPDGDIIDCVHISKQPAFDNPILKNHTIQMWPSSLPRGLSQDSIASRPFNQTWHKNGRCPENTIPIRRTKEEDVLRANSVSSYGKKRPKFSELAVTTGHQWAQASAQGYNMYYGTEANINLWQPTVQTPSDFSLTQFWVTSGSYQNNDLNTIEVGWQVYPQMYGDNSPKLFIYWTRDAYKKTGCYDLTCSGFVQTNNDIAFGAASQLNPLSTYGGSQYDINILVWKDAGSGNWWLRIGNKNIGYWPSSIFTNLASSATSVQWGGEVFSSSAGQTSTQMGSGHFPNEGFGKASYIRNIQVVEASNTLRSPSGLGPFASRPNCYNVAMRGAGTNWGMYFYYGGPGRNANCQ